MNKSLILKILQALAFAFVILLAFIVIDSFLESHNKWIRRSTFVFVGLLVLFVQIKFGKRVS